MSEAHQEALEQAYELIEADKLAEAEAILKPILGREPDNVDAWWLYAHAVTDPETARMALNQVLNLDNNYEGAQELLQQLDATLRSLMKMKNA
jgi:thioredoxin-like negative regulator of GroEL